MWLERRAAGGGCRKGIALAGHFLRDILGQQRKAGRGQSPEPIPRRSHRKLRETPRDGSQALAMPRHPDLSFPPTSGPLPCGWFCLECFSPRLSHACLLPIAESRSSERPSQNTPGEPVTQPCFLALSNGKNCLLFISIMF